SHIPFEIQEEIIKKLPVKLLIRFTSVSKTWKSFIHSSKFIIGHSLIQPQNLLVSYYDVKIFKEKKKTVVMWNPYIRKSVSIVVPDLEPTFKSVVGFGVCPHTFEPKLVNIRYRLWADDRVTFIPWQVEVFSLRSWAWRSPLCGTNNLPRTSIKFMDNHVVVDGIMYWLDYDKTAMQKTYALIISFDLTSEEFGDVYFPDGLATVFSGLFISKLNESLVVLKTYKEYEKRVFVVLKPYKEDEKRVCDVWMMMKHGVPKSFTKLYTIKAPHLSASTRVLGFRKNGEPIINADTEYISNGNIGPIFVNTYTETLLLLDESDSIIR
uniref:F-box protein At1g30790-like n=1 Tax=Erigeron canadensis TaxID=72917 RepID=UPI001CB96439